MFLSREIRLFTPILTRILSLFKNKTWCSCRYMLNNMPGGMACSTPVWYCAKDSKKLLKKLSVTSKVSIIVQKNLFKLMVGEGEEVTRDVKWNSVSPWKKSVFISFHSGKMKWKSFLLESFDLYLFLCSIPMRRCFVLHDFISG